MFRLGPRLKVRKIVHCGKDRLVENKYTDSKYQVQTRISSISPKQSQCCFSLDRDKRLPAVGVKGRLRSRELECFWSAPLKVHISRTKMFGLGSGDITRSLAFWSRCTPSSRRRKVLVNPNRNNTVRRGNGVWEDLTELLDLHHDVVEVNVDAVSAGAGGGESWRQMTKPEHKKREGVDHRGCRQARVVIHTIRHLADFNNFADVDCRLRLCRLRLVPDECVW